MALDDYLEYVWDHVPEGATPERFGERLTFLLGEVRPGDRVLDIGCGEGQFSAALVAHGAEPVAVEVADEPLRRLRARFPEVQDVRRARAGKPFPLDDDSVDVVWAGEVLEHVVDAFMFLGECRRVLRPGGRLVVTTPDHPPSLLLRLALDPGAFAEHFEPGHDHVRFFNARSLRLFVSREDFDVQRCEAVGGHLHLVAA